MECFLTPHLAQAAKCRLCRRSCWMIHPAIGRMKLDLRGCYEMLWVTLRRIHRHAPVIESHTSLKNKRRIKNCLILKSRRLTVLHALIQDPSILTSPSHKPRCSWFEMIDEDTGAPRQNHCHSGFSGWRFQKNIGFQICLGQIEGANQFRYVSMILSAQ